MRILQICVLSLLILPSCSSRKKNTDDTTMTSVTYNIREKATELKLAAVITFSSEISGCVSGFTQTGLTEADTTVNIPDGDSNCLYKIQSISIDGEVFDTSAQDFSQGSSFLVTGAANTQLLFNVNSQILTPIAGPQSVDISFSSLETGNASTVSTGTTAGIVVAGSDPLNLNLEVSTLVSINSASGAGTFRFKLQCDTQIADNACSDVPIGTIKANIDSETNLGGSTLDIATCTNLANAGTTGSVVAVGDSEIANGGLLTSNIVGPAPMFATGNTDMILAILSDKGACKFYNVTIALP